MARPWPFIAQQWKGCQVRGLPMEACPQSLGDPVPESRQTAAPPDWQDTLGVSLSAKDMENFYGV